MVASRSRGWWQRRFTTSLETVGSWANERADLSSPPPASTTTVRHHDDDTHLSLYLSIRTWNLQPGDKDP